MPLPQMCLCFLVRRLPDRSREVLLGRKLRGLGAGNLVGLGGKVEAGEDVRAATVREVAEEACVSVDPADLVRSAFVTFRFPSRPAWDQQATVFVATRWSGQPRATPEIVPRWWPVDGVPYDRMWADARHWLPLVLAGSTVEASFGFRSDLATVAAYDVRQVAVPTPAPPPDDPQPAARIAGPSGKP